MKEQSLIVNYLVTPILAVALALVTGCGASDIANEPAVDQSMVGYTTVPLDANKAVVRGKEAVLGNLVADAFVEYARENGYDVDFAIVNGGNLRFDPNVRADGIYPAGEITRENVSEILPFGNSGIILTITGGELKKTLERSVHHLPLTPDEDGNGAFLHFSAGVQVVADLSRQPQVIDELNQETEIVTPGERIVSMTLNGDNLDLEANYLVLASSFIAGGGDGHLTLGQIEDSRRTDLGEDLVVALENYFRQNSPVTPIVENRIIID